MDVAYDHIQEEVLSAEDAAKKEGDRQRQGNLNTEFQEAYRSFSASPWGARLGGFFNDVKKQSGTYYEGAKQEATSLAKSDALKGFTDLKLTLVSRARSMSAGQSPTSNSSASASSPDQDRNEEAATTGASEKQRSESEALRESAGLISRFRIEATKRLKEIEKAEDAADEALIKFGTNIRNFLRDAVTVAPPSADSYNKDGTQKILFESKDQDGKRVIHTTRFDAQLHAIHSSFDSFAKDPISPEYEKWKSAFDVEKKTEAIAIDLDKYEELRRAMEKLVPEQVDYAHFWTRYYFLRMVVETEEQRRREMLKGAALDNPTETISWDDDSDDESSTPAPQLTQQTHSSTATIQPSSTPLDNTEPSQSASTLKPTRRSQDQYSQPDSEASYDLVLSGDVSRAPGSPMREEADDGKRQEDDDDEEEPDWE